MSDFDRLEERISNMDETINSLLERSQNLVTGLETSSSNSTSSRNTTPHTSTEETNNVSANAAPAPADVVDESSSGSSDTTLYTLAYSGSIDNSSSSSNRTDTEDVERMVADDDDDDDDDVIAAVVTQPEIITLDDTVDITDAGDEVQYVQTFQNEAPVLIDLCASVDDHSYSRGLDTLPGMVNHSTPVRVRRRRNRIDHTYADQPPLVEIIEPVATGTESSVNSPLGHCPICLDSYMSKLPQSTICGHIFCKACITQCIIQTKQCPLCRKKLTIKGIHPIHF